MKQRTIVFCLLLCLSLFLVTGVSQAQEKEKKRISYDPSLTGETGIISTLVADSLPKGKFSIGLFYHNFDRELTDLDVNQYAVSFAYGLLDNLEIALSVIGIWQIDYDQVPMIQVFPPRVLTAFPFPITTIEEGFGDIYFGAKYTLVSESEQRPGMAFRGFVKLPTGSENEGFGSGATDFGADLIISKHVSDNFLLTANAGFTFLGTPNHYSDAGLDFGNDFRYGLGGKVFATENFRLLFELTGLQAFSDDDFPQENIADFRLGLEYKLDNGLRLSLGWTQALIFEEPAMRPSGAFAMISFSPWSRPKEKPKPKTHTISGYVRSEDGEPIPDTRITFSNEGGTVFTGNNGFYAIDLPAGWSGTARPDKGQYIFTPESREYTNLSQNFDNQNYIGRLPAAPADEYKISGHVRTEGGEPIPEVVLTFSGLGEVKTDAKGYYEKVVKSGWNGTVTPKKGDYSFEPPSRRYSNVSSDMPNQDYIGKLPPCEYADIYFDFDRYDLRPDSVEKLNGVVACLKRYPEINIVIEGHCCYIGTEEYNLALGQARANAVKNYLVTHGIAADRIETISWGEAKPAFDNSREETRRFNRRGHFVIRTK